MIPIILIAADVQIILKSSRTESYEVIQEIKSLYPFSRKLKGTKIKTADLANNYDLNLEEIEKTLKG